MFSHHVVVYVVVINCTRAVQPVATCCQSFARPRSPRSHYDVILIMTSFAAELATPTVTDVWRACRG